MFAAIGFAAASFASAGESSAAPQLKFGWRPLRPSQQRTADLDERQARIARASLARAPLSGGKPAQPHRSMQVDRYVKPVVLQQPTDPLADPFSEPMPRSPFSRGADQPTPAPLDETTPRPSIAPDDATGRPIPRRTPDRDSGPDRFPDPFAPRPDETTPDSGLEPPGADAGQFVPDPKKDCETALSNLRACQLDGRLARGILYLKPPNDCVLESRQKRERTTTCAELEEDVLVVAIETQSITVQDMNGVTRTYSLSADVSVIVDGERGAVGQIEPRMTVAVNIDNGTIRRISKCRTTLPFECNLGSERFALDTNRQWPETCYTWKASGLCHKPLYFEQSHMERYGHSWGPVLDPVLSGAHFFASVPLLPYHMGLEPPCECIYPLGHYRPGNCAPGYIEPFPWSIRAVATEAAAASGLIFALP